jgi:vitamin B12 transporter
LLALTASVAWPTEDEEVTETDKIIVSATGTTSTLDKIGGNSATVITSEDIEAKKQVFVGEILKGVPGLDIVSTGGPGTTTSAFIRGADPKNTLVMIDGIMVNDPSSPTREADIGSLNLDNIERVEVVRGALSVLYGTNATAGVINIITKKGSDKPSVFGSLEGGSYNTWKASAGASGALQKFNFSATLSGMTSDGFSIANNENDRILHDGNTSEEDGYENGTFSGKFGVDISPDFDINAIVRYSSSETDIDDYYFTGGFAQDQVDFDPMTYLSVPNPNGQKKQKAENDQTFYKADVHNFFWDRAIESTLYYQGSLQDRKTFDSGGKSSYEYKGETRAFGWNGTHNYNNINYLSLGIYRYDESMDNKTGLDESQYITSIFVQDQFFYGDVLDIVAGLRYDDHESFGSATTYRIAPAVIIPTSETTLKISWGTGFRAPSLFELYSDYGNPDLKEEESRGWDAGFEQPLIDGRLKFGATYFDMKYEDRIDYDFATSSYNQLPGDTKTSGVEAFIKVLPKDDLEFLLNYTYTNTEDPEGEELVRRPKNKIYFNTRYRFMEKGVVNLDIIWADKRRAVDSSKDVLGNAVEKLDSYTVVNLSAAYDVLAWLQVYGRIDNLFDEFYEEAWSYATPGISGYLGVRLKY